ncbi:O-antigen translocase [Flavobacterium sp. DGU11]|uniref:O-antigen translocase n=1 Tax=Flavobacterium arundinis TaxID=3139143 RepID=A0ABU9HVE0_9FLAO
MNYIKNILKTPLFKITSLNSASVLVRIAGGLLASKMIALFIGPAGMALTGNLRNFLTGLDSFSTLGFQNGIIKYTAENSKDNVKLYRTLATIFISIFFTILLLSAILLLLSGYWEEWIFGTGEYVWVFKVLAFSLPWYTGNLIFMAVLNGLGKYKQVIGINIWGNAAGVILSAFLIWKLGVTGAFLGLILYPALLFLFSFYLLYRTFPRFPFLRWRYFDYSILRGLLSYSQMALVSAVFGPVVYLSIRNNLMDNFSPNEAGLWESISRISTFYLMFVTTLLTVYFLPNLSMSKSNIETRTVFRKYYKGIVPVFVLGLAAIYFLRYFIIRILFSAEFLPMEKLFFWQLLGDFFKVCSLILGYELFAKKLTRTFIITEIMSFVVLYFSSKYLISIYGSEGAVMAHAFTYFVYLAVLVVYFRKKYN